MIQHHNPSPGTKFYGWLFRTRKRLTKETLQESQGKKTLFPAVPKKGYQHATYNGLDVYSRLVDPVSPHIVFFHGGAYIHPAMPPHLWMLKKLAKAAGANVHMIDYPLAPKATVSTTVPGIVAAIDKMVDGLQITQLYLAGDSAGGGLAMAVSRHLKATVKGMFLFSPWLDLSMENDAISGIINSDPVLHLESLKEAASAYSPNDVKHPDASPLFAEDIPDVPIHVYAGSYDILYPDSIALEQRRPSVHLHAFSQAVHDFVLFPLTEEQRFILSDVAAVIKAI